MTLKEDFIANKGEPVKFGDISVIQMDRIPILKGRLTIHFFGGNSTLVCGVALKSAKGYICLPNGDKVKSLYVWHEKTLPNVINYNVECPDGELRVWNIYRMTHTNGTVTEDAWTNNACMYVQEISTRRRRYNCSDGLGEIDLDNHIFELEWNDE